MALPRLIFFVLTLFGYSAVLAQAKADSVKIHQLTSLAYELFLKDPDSAIILGSRAVHAANESQLPLLEAKAYYVLSKSHWAKANYHLSLEYGSKASKLFNSLNQPVEEGYCHTSLARTFIDLKNYAQAEKLLKAALSIARDTNHELLFGEVYREYSMLYSVIQEFDSSMMMIDKGLSIYSRLHDTLNVSILFSRKAKVFHLLKDYNQSVKYNRLGIQMDSLVGNKRGLGISYLTAGQNYYALGKTDSAIYFLKKSIEPNRIVSNYATLIKVHELLSSIYTERKLPLLSVQELLRVSQYKDSVYNTQKNAQMQEMQSLYELDTKEKTISTLEHDFALQEKEVKNQRIIMMLLTVGILLLGALILMMMRLRRIQVRTTRALATKNIAIEKQKEEIQLQAQKLQELNQLKSKLFSVISHDLRGPISTLHALLELLTNNKMTPEEFMLFSHKVKSNINLTQRTLENLLTWSLSQMDGLKTEKKSVNIRPIIEETCKFLDDIAERKTLTLDRRNVSDNIVICDPDQIELILRNLIHNAIKFSKQEGTVIIQTIEENSNCIISIRDNGIGMSQQELETIRGAHEHFTKSGTMEEKGTGLGLMLCQEFIRRNEGTFRVESVVDKGTEVAFSLPLAIIHENA